MDFESRWELESDVEGVEDRVYRVGTEESGQELLEVDRMETEEVESQTCCGILGVAVRWHLVRCRM